ncbi:MAG: FAD-dependent oxidoreductase [Thermoleophilia bacterium]|nr:FAD-dependent oxidoreductase [Thermoleophilia bacterium]
MSRSRTDADADAAVGDHVSHEVLIIGGGLAGLVTAASLLELGHDDVVVADSGTEPGGTSIWSAGWIWRYRSRDDYATYAPAGERTVQHAIWHELPTALKWLESATGPFLNAASQNPLNEGVQADVPALCAALARQVGARSGRLRVATEINALERRAVGGWRAVSAAGAVINASYVVCAGGGYGANFARIARESGASASAQSWWQLRNAGGSLGTTIDLATQLGGVETGRRGECYMRATPVMAASTNHDVTSGEAPALSLAQAAELAQVYARHAVLVDERGRRVEQPPNDWADTQVINALAHRTGRGWLLVGPDSFGIATPHGSVGELIAAAEQAGSPVLWATTTDLVAELSALGVELHHDAAILAAAGKAACAVPVVPGITQTTGGILVDAQARVQSRDRLSHATVARLYAAGVDVGGVAAGGYASGLAQALALGRIAARSIATEASRSRECV